MRSPLLPSIYHKRTIRRHFYIRLSIPKRCHSSHLFITLADINSPWTVVLIWHLINIQYSGYIYGKLMIELMYSTQLMCYYCEYNKMFFYSFRSSSWISTDTTVHIKNHCKYSFTGNTYTYMNLSKMKYHYHELWLFLQLQGILWVELMFWYNLIKIF